MTPPGNMINSAANSVRSGNAARLPRVCLELLPIWCRVRRTDSGVSAGRVSRPLGFRCSSLQRTWSMPRTAVGAAVAERSAGSARGQDLLDIKFRGLEVDRRRTRLVAAARCCSYFDPGQERARPSVCHREGTHQGAGLRHKFCGLLRACTVHLGSTGADPGNNPWTARRHRRSPRRSHISTW